MGIEPVAIPTNEASNAINGSLRAHKPRRNSRSSVGQSFTRVAHAMTAYVFALPAPVKEVEVAYYGEANRDKDQIEHCKRLLAILLLCATPS